MICDVCIGMHTEIRKEKGRRQTIRNYYQKLTNGWKVYGDNQRDKMRQRKTACGTVLNLVREVELRNFQKPLKT